ncbi:unnamed protein product [Caenorhabditis nigoni]
MEIKEYHIGKTAPEMIAELERHQENHRLWTKKFCLVQIANAVDEIDNKNNIVDKDQETEQYKLISYCVQRLLNPNPMKDFRTMPDEELIEHYNIRMYYYNVWEQHKAKKAAEPIDAKNASREKTVNLKTFQNMGNRVKTAATGLFESIKKRIGKKNKEDKY